MSERVRCGVCHQDRGEGESATQAHGCASHVSNGMLYGHYGSAYDICKYRLVDLALPALVDPVCDICIAGWLRTGQAIYVGEYLDWNEGMP